MVCNFEDIIEYVRKGKIFCDGDTYYKIDRKNLEIYYWEECYYQEDTGKIAGGYWEDVYYEPYSFLIELFRANWFIVSQEQFNDYKRKDRAKAIKKLKESEDKNG